MTTRKFFDRSPGIEELEVWIYRTATSLPRSLFGFKYGSSHYCSTAFENCFQWVIV